MDFSAPTLGICPSSVLIAPCRSLVTFLRLLVGAVFASHRLGLYIHSCRSLLVSGRFPPASCGRCRCSTLPWTICLLLSRPDFPAAFTVSSLALLCTNPAMVRDLHLPHSPRLPTCQCTQRAWSCADWAVNRQVCTLRASVDSDSDTDDRRLVEYLVEILATSVDADHHWQQKQTC